LIDPIVELDPKYHYENKVEKSDKVGKLTPKEKEVKLKTLKDKDLLRPITIDNEMFDSTERRTHSTEYTARYCPKCYVYNAIIN
jgi:hypothetical protein